MAARRSRLVRALVLLLVLAAAAACARKPPPARVARAYDLPPALCLAELARQGARFEALERLGEGGCRVEAPVRVHATTARMARPLVTSCAMALALMDWERRSLQPRAVALLGQPVARLHHFGSHACRGMRGRGGRPSVHAVARALDLHAFELADGRILRVDRHWRPRGPERRFLHAVARDACAVFSVTLTPNSDRDHADHLHLDIGPHARCGA